MLDFLKRWFSGTARHKRGSHRNTDPTLDLGPIASTTPVRRPDRDVHQLMIEATSIRKKQGYPEAILFLKELAEIYLVQENTALVTCVNKLIRYMNRDPEGSYEKSFAFLSDLLKKLPLTDPYFLNLHITMATLIESRDRRQAIRYLLDFLGEHPPSQETYYHLIKLAELFGLEGETTKAREYLDLAKKYWDTKFNRLNLIRMQRRWFRTAAKIAALSQSRKEQSDYLVYRMLEFALDMARVLDPAHIEDFHKRKDQYFNKIRGFVEDENFEQALGYLGIKEKKEDLVRRIYGYVFEEMPLVMGVSEAQLHYTPGQPESLEEVRQKKMFSDKPFTQLPAIQEHIRQMVNKFTL